MLLSIIEKLIKEDGYETKAKCDIRQTLKGV